jgi:hypothetical protein
VVLAREVYNQLSETTPAELQVVFRTQTLLLSNIYPAALQSAVQVLIILSNFSLFSNDMYVKGEAGVTQSVEQ